MKIIKSGGWMSLIVMITGFSMLSQARVTVDQQIKNSFERALKSQQESLLSLLRASKSAQSSWNSNSAALQNDFDTVPGIGDKIWRKLKT